MRLKIILFALVASVFVTGCNKEDFNILKNPLIIEGDLNPEWGIPLVKWSVSVSDMLGWVDTFGVFSVYVDDNDMLSMRYQDSLHSVYEYSDAKCSVIPDWEIDDTIRLYHTILGQLNMPIFSALQNEMGEEISMKGLYVSASTFLKGFINDTVHFNYDHGIKIYLDSIKLTVMCADGFNPVIPLTDVPRSIEEEDLILGKRISILNRYDISSLLNRKPKYIRYSVQMVTAVPITAMFSGSAESYLKTIGFDSIVADTRCIADFPLQVYCHNIGHADTVEWKLPVNNPDQVFDTIEKYVSLDSTCSLVIEARNSIPFSMGLSINLLDSNMNLVYENVLNGLQEIRGASLKMSDMVDSYISDEYGRTLITIPVDFRLLKQLRNTRHISYRIHLNSSTDGAQEETPTVAIRSTDKVDLRARIVMSPHIHFSFNTNKNISK